MLRSTMTTPAAGVDHGHRPTYGHDATYADVETQVPSCASPGHTEIWLIVDGLLAGRRPRCKGGAWWPPTFRPGHPVLARQGSRCLLRRDEVT
jgi:hypothetical protein